MKTNHLFSKIVASACLLALLYGATLVSDGRTMLRVIDQRQTEQDLSAVETDTGGLAGKFGEIVASITLAVRTRDDPSAASTVADEARETVLHGCLFIGASIAGLLLIAYFYFESAPPWPSSRRRR